MSDTPKDKTPREIAEIGKTFMRPHYIVTKKGCWVWKHRISWNGYGVIVRNKKEFRAHRLSYELFVGPILEGLQIDHLCRNRACVNPAHLEAVTQGVNVLRGFGPSAINKRKTHCNNGHAYLPNNLLLHPQRGIRHRQCAICTRKAWRIKWHRNKGNKNGMRKLQKSV